MDRYDANPFNGQHRSQVDPGVSNPRPGQLAAGAASIDRGYAICGLESDHAFLARILCTATSLGEDMPRLCALAVRGLAGR